MIVELVTVQVSKIRWICCCAQKVVVDVEVLKRVMGYNWDSVLCCYRTIIRIQANPDKHDMDADNQIRFVTLLSNSTVVRSFH